MGEPESGGGGEGEGGFMNERTVQGVETGNTWLGRLSQVGDIASGAATYAKGAEAYSHIAPFGGTMFDAFTNGSEAVAGGESALGGLGKVLGPAGQVMGGISAAANGAMLANDISKEGFSNAYHDSTAYNHAGGAALGAAHAVLPFLGPYGEAANLALTGGEMAANAGGAAAGWAFGDKAKFNADSVAGGLIRGTFGDQSPGEQARQGIGNVFGHGTAANIAGGIADVGVNVAALPMSLGATVGRGIYNEGSAIVDSIANGDGAVGHALNSAGHWVGNEASTIGHGIASGASTAANWMGNTASTIGSGIASGASAVGHGISSVGHGIASGVGSVLSW